MDKEQTGHLPDRASAKVSIREVVDKRFVGKDPHMQEQQSNSGKADMSHQQGPNKTSSREENR